MNGYMIVGIVVVVIIVLLLATNKKLIETLKNIYKIEELRKRILYTLGLLLVFRLGCFVVIPGINPNALGADSALADQMNSNTLLGLLDVFSGGAFANAAIFALGVMPYITAFFMPREKGDRPNVVPDGAVNFAFLGQFAETPRDTIFTTEYSMRTGMEAVYTLLNIDRGVPEVWGSVYDVRDLLDATVKLRDGKKPIDMELNLVEKMALKKVLGKIEGTDLEKLLKEYHVI